MKADEVSRCLGYLGYDARISHQAASRHRAPKMCLVAVSVLCVLFLTALVIHAARPGESSMTAPQMDHISSMDDPTVVYQDSGEDTTNDSQSTLRIPGCASLECTGPWYPIFAGIGQALLTVPAE